MITPRRFPAGRATHPPFLANQPLPRRKFYLFSACFLRPIVICGGCSNWHQLVDWICPRDSVSEMHLLNGNPDDMMVKLVDGHGVYRWHTLELTEAIDTTTPGGYLVFHVFEALGPFDTT